MWLRGRILTETNDFFRARKRPRVSSVHLRRNKKEFFIVIKMCRKSKFAGVGFLTVAPRFFRTREFPEILTFDRTGNRDPPHVLCIIVDTSGPREYIRVSSGCPPPTHTYTKQEVIHLQNADLGNLRFVWPRQSCNNHVNTSKIIEIMLVSWQMQDNHADLFMGVCFRFWAYFVVPLLID